jgi:hypothetical protein
MPVAFVESLHPGEAATPVRRTRTRPLPAASGESTTMTAVDLAGLRVGRVV